jgi:hypothetical protein
LSVARYAAVALGVVAATLAAAWPAVSPEARGAALFGAGLALANTVLAYFLTVRALGFSPNVFLGVVLGGMLGRMVVMLIVVVVAVKGLGLPALPLAIALLSYFVAFLTFELTVLHRRTSAPGAAAR